MRIVDGKLDLARQIESPNFDKRPEGHISLIVVHCISLPAGHFGNDFVERLFCNQLRGDEHPDFTDLPNLKVSSHLFVRRDGEVLQFVPFHLRAWHAGQSCHQGRQDCNDYSVGIELEGIDSGAYTDAQYEVLAEICSIMLTTWQLEIQSIVGHSDIAPERKEDPGPGFDWQRLQAQLEVE